jgi:hypothetical protein
MSRFLFFLWLFGSTALAKPWQGISPGTSSALDVIGKFGTPSRKLEKDGQTILVYLGVQAIKGTTQAQFKLAPGTQTVARIDVYPALTIDVPALEESYGPKCQTSNPPEPCYVIKEGPRPSFIYPKLGVAVFFKANGTVLSFAFFEGKG